MENDDTQLKVFPTSRKRSADGQMELDGNHTFRIPAKLRLSMNRNQSSPVMDERENGFPKMENAISERRRALFEPLAPKAVQNGMSAESLLPQPDFESASYPRGWVVGKKRKLVNVDVVESMRRVAVLEMNRKDREIDGLHEQLEEDARCLEHLQHQLLQESSKRADAERENALLQSQITMLMDMLEQNENEQEPVHDHCLPD